MSNKIYSYMGQDSVFFYTFAKKCHNIWDFNEIEGLYKIWWGIDSLKRGLIMEVTWKKILLKT